MHRETILIVDDEKNIVELIKYNLDKEGYKTICAYNGFEAVTVAEGEKPDLIVLDVMLPGQSGMDVCRILRKTVNTPIIMVTAKGSEIDKILGLEIGADDHITKPFSPRELVARIKAVLRRTSNKREDKDVIKFGNLSINLTKHDVYKDREKVELRPKEFDLLRILCSSPGTVFSRDSLLEQIWGYEFAGGTRTVDVHVRRLRQKIEADPDRPEMLITVHGIGYKFQTDSA